MVTFWSAGSVKESSELLSSSELKRLFGGSNLLLFGVPGIFFVSPDAINQMDDWSDQKITLPEQYSVF